MKNEPRPWPALWAMALGFFMILVDSTIVSIAIPALSESLDADVTSVLWVTSAYLLAFAVPLLITGRLGDRFGPKVMYQSGLVIFTLASLACGLAPSIGVLITARVVQGIGASLMTPQTMAVITRLFAPERRGAAMALWGSTAGVATLVGPLAGGLLVDGFGWEWIFFVNVPVGVLAFILAARLVPSLPTHRVKLDWVGILLSAIGLFLVVFGVQEGQTYDWGTITGIITVPGLIILGVVVLAAFVVWEGRLGEEALLPLKLFKDRNFALANLAITAVGFMVASFAIPLFLWAQVVKGYSPTTSALLMIPMPVVQILLSQPVGKLVHRVNPRWLAAFGLALFSGGVLWLARLAFLNASVVWAVAAFAVIGIANAFVWSPLSVSATHNLPRRLAGAGSGVYNTTRQIGSVLGSASIAAVMASQLADRMPGGGTGGSVEATASANLPAFLHPAFSQAMGVSLVLPAVVLLAGLVAALFLAKPVPHAPAAPSAPAGPEEQREPEPSAA